MSVLLLVLHFIIVYSGRNGQIPVEDDFAKSISKWNSDSPRRKNVTLNERQVTAMKHAWTRSFQLIQGPPGKSIQYEF